MRPTYDEELQKREKVNNCFCIMRVGGVSFDCQ